jgi:DNA helicase II / ATP-dependent DNA helicase PcrA
MNNRRTRLSEAQNNAVKYEGAALVAAGAGSGKTRTLTSKIAHLIDNGYSPERIIAITFTNKAAEEMKSRLFSLTGLSQDRFPWVRTYHSACFKILKRHCTRLGYSNPLQIYADYHQQKLIKDILYKLNIDKKYIYAIHSHISNAKNSGDPMGYFDTQPRVSFMKLYEVYRIYEKELMEKNAVDFDNILLQTRNLLRDYLEIRAQYHALFDYVLVDEYQDTNDLQEEITRLLLGNANIFCVGDDWQAIYGFRGSNVNHFLRFANHYKNSKIFRLEQNYRSAEEIVKAANELISYNPHQMGKDCYSTTKGGVVETHTFFNDEEEADWVADKILALCGQKIPYDRIAVLYRTKFCSLSFEKSFRASGIPYRMLGSKGFFERKEILDLTSYLTAAVFIKDDVSFERILNTPKRGIGPSSLNKFYQLRNDASSLQETVRGALSKTVLSPKTYESLNSLIALLDQVKTLAPEKALHEIIHQTDYTDYLRGYSQSTSDLTARMENIEQLMYSAANHENLMDFLEEASLVKEDKKEEEGQDQDSRVNLSTIHASKGLEYQAVFVVGCEENLLPHWKSKENDSEISEERRLMYVAMTRAESYLYLTSASYRKGQYNPVSRFIEEIAGSIHVSVN